MKNEKVFRYKGLQMESKFMTRLGRGFSIALGTGLPLPSAEGRAKPGTKFKTFQLHPMILFRGQRSANLGPASRWPLGKRC